MWALFLVFSLIFAKNISGVWAASEDSPYKSSRATGSTTTNRQGSSYGSYDSGLGMSSGRSIFRSRSQSDGKGRETATKRDDKKDSQKTRERESNQPGAKGSKPAPKSERTVKGKQPPPKKGTTKGGQSRGSTTVEFKMRASSSANILCLETTDLASTMHTVAQVGQTFVTRVVFRNGQQAPFDKIEFTLKYDPGVLELEGVDDESVAPFLAEPATAQKDAGRGLFVYRARFAEPRKDDFLVICKLQWRALAPAEHTPIDFVNNPSSPSRVLSGDKNLLVPPAGSDEQDLELEPSPRQGLLGADIAIAPTAEQLEEMDATDLTLGGVALASQIADGTAEGGLRLSIVPRRQSVKVSEEFVVDVQYENPSRVEIDSVKVTLKFDPTVLEVVDWDDNGWITKGINVFDGDYHEELPFDFHIRNVAYNTLGQVIYQTGFSSRTPIPARGTLFSVRFRAKAPSPATRIRFEFDETEKPSPTTLSFLGYNLIGTPPDRSAGLRDATVRVEP